MLTNCSADTPYQLQQQPQCNIQFPRLDRIDYPFWCMTLMHYCLELLLIVPRVVPNSVEPKSPDNIFKCIKFCCFLSALSIPHSHKWQSIILQ